MIAGWLETTKVGGMAFIVWWVMVVGAASAVWAAAAPPGVAVSSTNPVPIVAATNRVEPGARPDFVVSVDALMDEGEKEYRELLSIDDTAQEAMDQLIRDADARGAAADNAALQKQIDDHIATVDKAYKSFLSRHADHARARVAYGSFLNDTAREAEARDQWEKALKYDPKNAAIYNNLAGSYGHSGPVTNAFVHYEKAIELDPAEAVYHQNFATTVFLFRKDVMEHYGITNEQQVFDKALGLYRKAAELDPRSFFIAADLAQTYYGIKPPRHADALAAWRKAFELAGDDLEREGVRVHLARVLVQAGRFAEARAQLNLITNVNYAESRMRIEKTMETRESKEASVLDKDPPKASNVGNDPVVTSTNRLAEPVLAPVRPGPPSGSGG